MLVNVHVIALIEQYYIADERMGKGMSTVKEGSKIRLNGQESICVCEDINTISQKIDDTGKYDPAWR